MVNKETLQKLSKNELITLIEAYSKKLAGYGWIMVSIT